MSEKIAQFIAWHLPRKVIYWCAIRLMANATQGQYEKQEVPSLLAMEALQRWEPKGPLVFVDPPSKPERQRCISFLQPKDGPVIPGEEAREIVFAKNQPEYIPLRTIVGAGIERPVLSRWAPTDEQRERIAEGEDLYLRLLTFGGPLQPIMLFIAGEGNVSEPANSIQDAGCKAA